LAFTTYEYQILNVTHESQLIPTTQLSVLNR